MQKIILMKTFSCVVIFISILYQISSGAPQINKMASNATMLKMSDKSSNLVKMESPVLRKTVKKTSNCIVMSCKLKILPPLEEDGKYKRKIFRQRIKRSIGSEKVRGVLKPKEYDESYTAAPPSFVALVFLDIIAGIFTFNALVALLYLVVEIH